MNISYHFTINVQQHISILLFLPQPVCPRYTSQTLIVFLTTHVQSPVQQAKYFLLQARCVKSNRITNSLLNLQQISVCLEP